MARFDVYGIADLYSDLAALSFLPERVTADILNAEADVIVEAQRNYMEKMQRGPESTGISAKSVKNGRVQRGRDGPYISIYPHGDRKRGKGKRGKKKIYDVRNAEIAFLNEYGARGQAPRPAIRTANEQAAGKATEAGEKVYHAYLDSKNL